jgi:hypothetical protein
MPANTRLCFYNSSISIICREPSFEKVFFFKKMNCQDVSNVAAHGLVSDRVSDTGLSDSSEITFIKRLCCAHREGPDEACSFGWWLMARADLF